MALTNVMRGLAKAALPVAVADGLRAKILTDLYGRPRSAYEDAAGNYERTGEVNPLSAQHIETTLLDLSNIAANTTGYAYIDMDGYRFDGIQIEPNIQTDSITFKLWGTIQDDGTAPAACTYQDITLAYTGVASVTDTASIWILDTVSPFKYLRLEYFVANTGGSDSDLVVYNKKLF